MSGARRLVIAEKARPTRRRATMSGVSGLVAYAGRRAWTLSLRSRRKTARYRNRYEMRTGGSSRLFSTARLSVLITLPLSRRQHQPPECNYALLRIIVSSVGDDLRCAYEKDDYSALATWKRAALSREQQQKLDSHGKTPPTVPRRHANPFPRHATLIFWTPNLSHKFDTYISGLIASTLFDSS